MKRAVADRLLLLAWLAAVWVLLWGSLSPLTLLSALVVAPLCLAACGLPVVAVAARPRWRRVAAALGDFLVDLVSSSAQVAWATVRRGPRTRSAVVAVPVSAVSDMALTLIASRLSLVPGTLVLDVDRSAGLLYLYVFDVRGARDLERARRGAERTVSGMVDALGADGTGNRSERKGGGP